MYDGIVARGACARAPCGGQGRVLGYYLADVRQSALLETITVFAHTYIRRRRGNGE